MLRLRRIKARAFYIRQTVKDFAPPVCSAEILDRVSDNGKVFLNLNLSQYIILVNMLDEQFI